MDVEKLTEIHKVKDGTLLWRACESLPCGIVRPHVAQTERYIFIGGGFTGNSDLTRSIFRYDITQDTWNILPITPCNTHGLAIVNDLPTIVGGVNVITGFPSKTLFSFVEIGSKGKWCSLLPPMQISRSCSSVISTGHYLIVVGGVNEMDSSLYQDTVELLDIKEKKWYFAPSFPKPVAFMSIAASNDVLYLAGGLTPNGAIKDVFCCSISELVQNAKSSEQISVWQVLTKMPCYRSGCAVIQDSLVVFGGIANDDENTERVQSAIFVWNNETKTWKKLGNMPAKRTSLSVAVTDTTKAMLFGGYNNPQHWSMSLLSDVVEVVNLFI